eukprot:CAMPEP_0116826110 /NCGR_PEP_ID=MMETSP0418-20121206/2346_1 /TAXON_ID=1158023 /ORGANISM="Astrosyne radiata, Strain 13vi08-1A" /LENGTH=108 /DNA_ID=CAMNT_0004454707 /DNA_START=205 /DNA_END=531 /DNA_ORIENTATION=+
MFQNILTSSSSAEASHILLTTKDAKKELEKAKKEIGNDAKKFAQYAEKHSKCPSAKQGGSLGRFRKGDMAPPFDKAVFDPSNPLNTTIGPVQTTFGHHLIYIQSRKLQ